MAVTISELHVQVQESPPAAAAASSSTAEPKKDVDFVQALKVLRDRSLRLRAD